MQTIKDSIKTIAVSLITLSLISIAYAWTEPISTPPADNASIPVNTSKTGQIKDGGFWVGRDAGAITEGGGMGLIVENGNVGIGTTDSGTYKLNVNGDVYISGNNGNVLTKTSTGGVTNDGLPNCAAGAYLKWDGAKWICAISPPSGDKHYFITSEKYDGNLGGISGANAKCNSSATALPGRVYYVQLDTIANGWGVSGVTYFNSVFGIGQIGTPYNNGSSPYFWGGGGGPDYTCNYWTDNSNINALTSGIAEITNGLGIGRVRSLGSSYCDKVRGGEKSLLCVEN